jgi:hypothetical protein
VLGRFPTAIAASSTEAFLFEWELVGFMMVTSAPTPGCGARVAGFGSLCLMIELELHVHSIASLLA